MQFGKSGTDLGSSVMLCARDRPVGDARMGCLGPGSHLGCVEGGGGVRHGFRSVTFVRTRAGRCGRREGARVLLASAVQRQTVNFVGKNIVAKLFPHSPPRSRTRPQDAGRRLLGRPPRAAGASTAERRHTPRRPRARRRQRPRRPRGRVGVPAPAPRRPRRRHPPPAARRSRRARVHRHGLRRTDGNAGGSLDLRPINLRGDHTTRYTRDTRPDTTSKNSSSLAKFSDRTSWLFLGRVGPDSSSLATY